MTKSLLFALACAALWVGIMNSIQEICKERVILRREYMTGLRLGAYIISKLFVMGLICIMQSALLTGVFVWRVGCTDGIILPGIAEMYIITFLTAFSATAMGLFVSALFKNADRAMTVAPILLLPQLLFSGIIFKLEEVTETISYAIICRFSMQAYGVSADINSMESKVKSELADLVHPKVLEQISSHDDIFDFTNENFLFAVMMLAAYVVLFTLLAAIVVRGVKNDR